MEVRQASHTGIEDYSQDSEYLDYEDFCEICKKSILLNNSPIFNTYWCRGAHNFAGNIITCITYYEAI